MFARIIWWCAGWKDPGEGFSLDEIGHAAIANPDEDPIRHVVLREAKGLRPGGYGVLLAQKLDELIYNEKGNEVLLVKYVDRPGSAAVPASVSWGSISKIFGVARAALLFVGA
jgi:hypothetical protein